jgi:NitT/TauT family transport system substrate-binding protein
MKRLTAPFAAVFASLLAIGALAAPAHAEAKKEFNIAWSIYVGWMPWNYAYESGIVKKWADKYGISITFTQINDYVESINQYTAGKFDGVTMTNMDALTIPAAGGVDTTILVIGDYSNGNDGVVLKDAKSIADIKGRTINLVELSVSHYLLARALESAGMSEKDIKTVNTSDADILAAFQSDDSNAVVTWNPMLAEAKALPGVMEVFNSAKTPGEIQDTLSLSTQTLADNPDLGKALVGAWYEVLALVKDPGEAGKAARTAMATASGTDLAGYDAQLASTKMFFTPQEALAFANGPDLPKITDLVSTFCFDHALLGENVKSKDAIGILLPNGDTYGDKENVKLRYNMSFIQMAADGSL